MKTGAKKVEVIPERRYEEFEVLCDFCGQDATGRTPCSVCKRDLCERHQFSLRADSIQTRPTVVFSPPTILFLCPPHLFQHVAEIVANTAGPLCQHGTLWGECRTCGATPKVVK